MGDAVGILPLPQAAAVAGVSGAPRARRSAGALCDLLRTAYAAAATMSGSILWVPEFEVKLGFGRHLFELLDLMTAVSARVEELGEAVPRRIPGDDEVARVAVAIGTTETAPLLAALYRYWFPRLVGGMERLLADHHPLLDEPTGRLLRRHLPEIRDCLAWGEPAATAATDADPAWNAGSIAVWLEELAAGTLPPCEYARPTTARRDARFTTFADTRDYQKACDWHDTGDEYENRVLDLVRTNRDEIDAIETFAIGVFDLLPTDVPVQALRLVARLAWDEARHAAIGQALLAERGIDPFSVSCSMIGINVRGAMRGWDPLAQISLFGELGIIGPMRALARDARARDDDAVATSFEFIVADELMHLRRLRRLIHTHHPAGSITAAEEHVRRLAARLLAEQGVVGEDYYLSLNRREITELLGE